MWHGALCVWHGLLTDRTREQLINEVVSAGEGAYGASDDLLWGGGDAGIQGVTELIECKRTDDEWLRSVQEEIRSGSLSKDNHAFLHGWGTTVPGSWVKGRATCGQKDCQRLATTDEHVKRKRPGRKPLTKEMFI